VSETNAWLTGRNAVGSVVERIITPRRAVEETVLTLDGGEGRLELPVAIAADRDEDARIIELRVYYGTWSLTGRHASRPPPLQPDPDLEEPDVVGEYQRALAAGDLQAVVARSCALEYNVVRWGRTELAPVAGLAVYVRGITGRLAGARIYDDSDPPL
jgi:hypothetical protein